VLAAGEKTSTAAQGHTNQGPKGQEGRADTPG